MKVLDENLLAITLLVTIGFQLSCFFIAYTCQFDKITDLAGTSNFLLVAVMTLLISQTYFSRQIVVTALVCVWALRLGGFLLYRVIRRENDARFDEFRANFFKFLGFWIFQILWVWIVSLAVIFLNAASEDVSLNAGDYIGWTIWLIGFLLSSIADFSKDAFSSRMHKSSPFIRDGVWSISRHPNYAGEILCWIGIFVSAAQVFPSNAPAGFVSILSPGWTFVILMFVSGTNLAEERYNRKYGNSSDYLEYRNSTSPLIPFPASIYGVLPLWFKRLFCFEFSMYESGLELGMH